MLSDDFGNFKSPDVSECIFDIGLNGLVVEDELEVADVVEVDFGAVGQERPELLLDRTLEEEDLAVARVLHQPLDEVGHLRDGHIVIFFRKHCLGQIYYC